MTDRRSRWITAMRAGDYATAWALSHEDLAGYDHSRRDDPTLPYHQRWVWDGRSPDRRHCLVRCYHGLGDTIQFARFLPLLAARAASVTVEVQPRLLDILRGGTETPGLAFVPFDEAQPLPPAECDLEITELAFALHATPADAAMPYLRVDGGVLPRGTVGLCYGAGDWDDARSIPPALFAPLCAAAPCITLMPEATTLAVRNPGGCPFDMRATAALVAACDLVITVDTMIGHLAGAMGRPTWLLLKAEPDWRWPTDARRTPWYPATRLYAQSVAGDWTSVLADVAHDLPARWIKQAEG